MNEQGNYCPSCGEKVHYFSADLRPVFPKERLLFEIIKNIPLEFSKSSVWACNSRYYVDGKSYNLSTKELKEADAEKIISELKNILLRMKTIILNFMQNVFVRQTAQDLMK